MPPAQDLKEATPSPAPPGAAAGFKIDPTTVPPEWFAALNDPRFWNKTKEEQFGILGALMPKFHEAKDFEQEAVYQAIVEPRRPAGRPSAIASDEPLAPVGPMAGVTRSTARYALEQLPMTATFATGMLAKRWPVAVPLVVAAGAGAKAVQLGTEKLLGFKDVQPLTAKDITRESIETGLGYGAAELVARGLGGTHVSVPKAGQVAGEEVTGKEVARYGPRLWMTTGEVTGETLPGMLERGAQNVAGFPYLGSVVAQRYRQAGMENAQELADEIVSKLGPKRTAYEAGFEFKRAITGVGPRSEALRPVAQGGLGAWAEEGAFRAFKERGQQYWERELPALGQNVPALPTNLPAELQARISAKPTPLNVPQVVPGIGIIGTIRDSFPEGHQVKLLLKEFLQYDPQNVRDMMAAHEWVRKFLPKDINQVYFNEESERLAGYLHEIIESEMRNSALAAQAGGNPAGGAFLNKLEEANTFWREGKDVYESTIFQYLHGGKGRGEGAVEHFLAPGQIKYGDITEVKRLKKMIFEHAQLPTATAEEKARAKEGWNIIRRQFVMERLFKDPESHFDFFNLPTLKNRMNQAGREQLNELFNTDAAGRETLKNLRGFAEALSRQERTKPASWLRWARAAGQLGVFTLGYWHRGGVSGGGSYVAFSEFSMAFLYAVMGNRAATQAMLTSIRLANVMNEQETAAFLKIIGSEVLLMMEGKPSRELMPPTPEGVPKVKTPKKQARTPTTPPAASVTLSYP